MSKTKAKCDICDSPVWIVSSGEGTSHYEPNIGDYATWLEKELAVLHRAGAIMERHTTHVWNGAIREARKEATNA